MVEVVEFRMRATGVTYSKKTRSVLFAILGKKVEPQVVLKIAGRINRAIYDDLNKYARNVLELKKFINGLAGEEQVERTEEEEIRDVLFRTIVTVFGKLKIENGELVGADLKIRKYYLLEENDLEIPEEQSEEEVRKVEEAQEEEGIEDI